MLISTAVSTRDGLIPNLGPVRCTPHAPPGCAAAAVVFAGALVLDAEAEPLLERLVFVAPAVGAVEGPGVGVTATGVAEGGAGVATGAVGLARTLGAGAAATGALGWSEGRAGVTWRTTVASAAGPALAVGRAAGDAVTLTSTIAK
jgi:hypothetical protein